MKKILLKLSNSLDRWEMSIFDKSYQKAFAPISGFMAGTVLVAAAITIVALIAMVALNMNSEKNIIIAVAAIFGIVFIIVVIKVLRNIGVFSSVGVKIGYAAYILLIFAVCVCLLTYLSVIFLMLYILWGMIKAMLGGTQKQGSADSRDHLYCKHCARYPSESKYCDMGRKYTNDYTTVGTCTYYTLIS